MSAYTLSKHPIWQHKSSRNIMVVLVTLLFTLDENSFTLGSDNTKRSEHGVADELIVIEERTMSYYWGGQMLLWWPIIVE